MSNLLKNFVGIDISKLTFDAALIRAGQPGCAIHQQFEQSAIGLDQFKQWLGQQGVTMGEETLFCLEYTGIYNTGLTDYLCRAKARIWVEMAMKIKKSEGLKRSSNDKGDAVKIAEYAFRFQDRKTLWSPADECLGRIRHLLGQRDRIITSLKRLTVPVSELKQTGALVQARELEQLQRLAVKNLEKSRDKIDKAITEIIRRNQTLSEKVSRVQSVKGIGAVTSAAFLAYTNGFTSFDNAGQLACYCGVVPFVRKQSGTSVKSKPRVSPLANKKLKKLLHLCAMSAIISDTEIRNYYERKVQEGKNKMSVINAVRNKLVLRMFAVLRDNRDFVENYERKRA